MWLLNHKWLIYQVFSVATIATTIYFNCIVFLTKELFSMLRFCASQLLKVTLEQVCPTPSQVELPPHY